MVYVIHSRAAGMPLNESGNTTLAAHNQNGMLTPKSNKQRRTNHVTGQPELKHNAIPAKPYPPGLSARSPNFRGGGGGAITAARRVLPFSLARLSNLAPALLAALLFTSAFEARATDLTVNSAVTRVNNGVILDGDGKIVITNRGSITVNAGSPNTLGGFTSGAGKIGIFLRERGTINIPVRGVPTPRTGFFLPSNNNIITNDGEIIVSGDSSKGINVGGPGEGEKNELINNGFIRASGNFARGVEFSPNSRITNNNTIETRGNQAGQAILIGPNSTINNNGLIQTNNNDNAAAIAIEGSGGTAGGVINNNARGRILQTGNNGRAINVRANVTGFTVNNAGEITASGTSANSNGVHFQHNNANSNNTLNNNGGTITTNGGSAHAVLFGNANISSNNSTGNRLTNSGTITTNGESARAVLGGSGNTITNLKGGRIITKGNTAHGIQARDNNEITNAGTIITEGRLTAYGINVEANNTVVNSGTITTAGNNSVGITASAGNTITNSGTITTTGPFANAISARRGNNTITNSKSGTITTAGENSHAISTSRGNNTITNRGTLSSRSGHGIRLVGADNSVSNEGGAITISGDNVEAISARADNNRISNNGALTTRGANSAGIRAGNNTTLTLGVNSRITTTGANSDGIRIDGLSAASATLRQRGSIKASATGMAIAGDIPTLINEASPGVEGSGLIQGGATGVTAPYIGRLENSGRIIGRTGDGVRLTATANPRTATVENSGTIQGQTHGLNYGAHVITRLTNSGAIIGTTGAGVTFTGRARNPVTITNTGTIQGGTYGLNYGNNPIASLTNTSPRTLRGGSREALSAGSLLRLENSGTILSDRASAITLTRTATRAADITNSGTIQGNIHGLDYGNNAIASLTNSGTIRATTGIGVKAAGLTTLNNTGTIEGQTGIQIARTGTGQTGATINNAGTLRSLKGASGTALDLQGPGRDTLKLQAGSTLEGQVRWDGQDDTLHLATGPARLTLIDNNAEPGQAPTPFTIKTNGRPFLLNTTPSTARGQAQTTVTVLDPARIHTRTESTQSQWTGAVFQSLAQQQGARTGPNARNSTAAVHQALWVRPFGGLHNFKRDGLTPAARYRYGGALAGYAVASTDWQAGGFVGAAQDTLAARGPGADAEGRHVFAGAYARTRWQALNLKAGLLFGQSRTETEWQRLNNQVTGGQERVVYEGRRYVVSPELGLATRLTVRGVALEPALSLRYLGLFGAEEAERLVAGREPLRFRAEDRHIGLVRASVGVPLRFPVNAYGGQLYGQLRVGAEGRKRFGGERIEARRGDGVVRFKVADEATVRGFMGAGFEYVVPDLNLSFSADLEASYGSEAVLGVQGQLGFVWGF